MIPALVIGAGPAGLMAAEMLADAGHPVLVAEAKASAGRKLLMAGKSGLNLTKDEPAAIFDTAYGTAQGWLGPMLAGFQPADVRSWAAELGQSTFVGSTGRVFPEAMKASPLLRQWLGRLNEKSVALRTRWRWVGWDEGGFTFETPAGTQMLQPRCAVLALGGASWARLGSDGAWTDLFAMRGIGLAPFQPANMGILVKWSPFMESHFGAPLKNIRMSVGSASHRGECVVARDGLEGSLVYRFSSGFRAGERLVVDLCPDLTQEEVQDRLARQPRKLSRSNLLKRALRFDKARIALALELAREVPVATLGAVLKELPIPYHGVAPLDAAISVAGGVPMEALTPGLMLCAAPGVFCAGEMLDWEAPTGGYLLTGCLATGRWAGQAAARYLADQTR